MLMDGKSPEDTVEAFLRCLVKLKDRRTQLLKESDTWKQLIVEAASEPASEPGAPFWTALLELLVLLGVFWNISFAATATQARVAAATYALNKENKNKKIDAVKLKESVTSKCSAPTGMSKKYWLTDVLDSIPPDTRELLEAFQGLYPNDRGDAIWKNVPWNKLSDELKSFRTIVGNLEIFETLFGEAWKKIEIPIGISGNLMKTFLNESKEDPFVRLRTTIREELNFLKELRKEMVWLPPRRGEIKGLGKAKSEMSVLRDYRQSSADVTPNTLTLVAMQRTLMSMSCDAHGHAAGAPAIPSGSI